MVTGSIYLSSMSILLIAYCYWKPANNWGATGAIIIGAIVPVSFLVLQKIPATKHFATNIGPNIAGVVTFLAVAAAMVFGSLLKPKTIEEKGDNNA